MRTAEATITVEVQAGGRRYRAALDRTVDISIPLDFDGLQPSHFGAPPARAQPLSSGAFVGDTRAGGSCNAASYTITPHCNGTHTECVGHVTEERVAVRDMGRELLVPAVLVSLSGSPAADSRESLAHAPAGEDRLLTAAALRAALAEAPAFPGLIVRTLPNAADKRHRRYEGASPAPFFTLEAMHYLVQRDVRHLLVDTPSLDRARDEGHLAAHRVFWGLPDGSRRLAEAERPEATVTELIYVPDAIPDGLYLLNLQLAPFVSDAAPSRPLLHTLCEVS